MQLDIIVGGYIKGINGKLKRHKVSAQPKSMECLVPKSIVKKLQNKDKEVWIG